MLKKIDLADGNRIIFSKEEGYCTSTVSFSKGYLKNGELVKSIDMAIWDDMSFHGYLGVDYREEELPNVLEFEFTIDDPLYFCLDELLGNDHILIIDDDDTYDRMKKYMTIKKEETIIKIIFTNNKPSQFHHDKYGTFIKNIGPDGRSKIEDIKIKYRLVHFFRKCERALLEEYHQMSFFEYLEVLRVREIESSKQKLVKKKKNI